MCGDWQIFAQPQSFVFFLLLLLYFILHLNLEYMTTYFDLMFIVLFVCSLAQFFLSFIYFLVCSCATVCVWNLGDMSPAIYPNLCHPPVPQMLLLIFPLFLQGGNGVWPNYIPQADKKHRLTQQHRLIPHYTLALTLRLELYPKRILFQEQPFFSFYSSSSIGQNFSL